MRLSESPDWSHTGNEGYLASFATELRSQIFSLKNIREIRKDFLCISRVRIFFSLELAF